MEYPLDVQVHCTDGRCGRSTHIILNPTTQKVTHIVVRERQPSRVERLVPTRLVTRTAAEVILLDCSLEEFSKLEPFNQTHFVHGDLPHHAMDPKLTLLWPYVVPTKRTISAKVRPIPPASWPCAGGPGFARPMGGSDGWTSSWWTRRAGISPTWCCGEATCGQKKRW
jgi:hypothetical protein